MRRATPAVFFALPVTRRPADGMVTCHGGGYVASGPAGVDRLPEVFLPTGGALVADEGVGEQAGADALGVARRPRVKLSGGAGDVGEVTGEVAGDRVGLNGAREGEHQVEDRAEAVQVRAVIDG